MRCSVVLNGKKGGWSDGEIAELSVVNTHRFQQLNEVKTGRNDMKRILATFVVLALLVLPVLAVAEDTWIPREAKWSSEPPTPQQLVNNEQNEKKVVDKADQQTDASQAQAATPTKEKR